MSSLRLTLRIPGPQIVYLDIIIPGSHAGQEWLITYLDNPSPQPHYPPGISRPFQPVFAHQQRRLSTRPLQSILHYLWHEMWKKATQFSWENIVK
jgi:hypothetical protein